MKRTPIKHRPGRNQLSPTEWQQLFADLLTRSGGRCEALTPHCIAPDGMIADALPRQQVSIQHRRARGMGGSTLSETHSLANLLLLCGTGTTGCHGWVETQERAAALERGLWIGHDLRDGVPIPPQEYPVTLASGRRVLLDPHSPIYLPAPDEWGTATRPAEGDPR